MNLGSEISSRLHYRSKIKRGCLLETTAGDPETERGTERVRRKDPAGDLVRGSPVEKVDRE